MAKKAELKARIVELEETVRRLELDLALEQAVKKVEYPPMPWLPPKPTIPVVPLSGTYWNDNKISAEPPPYVRCRCAKGGIGPHSH